jgi:hypothetical protein
MAAGSLALTRSPAGAKTKQQADDKEVDAPVSLHWVSSRYMQFIYA